MVLIRTHRFRPMIVIVEPSVPILAHPPDLVLDGAALGPELVCVGWTFKDLDAEAFGDVEGDVAVDKPGAWIVGFEGHDDVAVAWH